MRMRVFTGSQCQGLYETNFLGIAIRLVHVERSRNKWWFRIFSWPPNGKYYFYRCWQQVHGLPWQHDSETESIHSILLLCQDESW